MEGHLPKKVVDSMQKVSFYDEKLSVALVENTMYVALKPIVHYLLLDWDIQYRHVVNDKLLSKYITFITMCGDDGQQQDTLCLHLEYLPGWLFHLQGTTLSDKLVRYQNECFQMLWRFFQREWAAQLLLQAQLPVVVPLTKDADELSATLLQVRNTALSVAQLANEQLTLPTSGSYPTSLVVLSQPKLEWMVAVLPPLADPVSDAQIDEIRLAIKTICDTLEKKGTTSKNAYRYVFEELFQSYGLTSYKLLSQDLFREVIAFLMDWHQTLLD